MPINTAHNIDSQINQKIIAPDGHQINSHNNALPIQN